MSDKNKKDEMKPALKTTEYKLPSGVVIHARKPNNGDRRILLEAPDTNRQHLMEVLAAVCITKIEYGADHWKNTDLVTEFKLDDRKEVWARMDDLELEDSISYVEAFGANNWPSEAMIKQVMDASKSSK